MQCSTKTCAQQRCFENGNNDFGVEAFWIGDAARVGYFVPLNGPLNGHPPSSSLCTVESADSVAVFMRDLVFSHLVQHDNYCTF